MEETLYYLKCTYGPGLFPTDYRIEFKSLKKNKTWACHVTKSHLKITSKTEGLAKVILKSFNKNEAFIILNNALEGTRDAYYVPKSEIVENPIISNILK